MSVHAVCTSYNEEDIIAATVLHLLAEGVEHVWFADASTDETPFILEALAHDTGRVTVLVDTEDYHYQPWWITRLAHLAGDRGATWIVPFDADEFWYALDGQPITEALSEIPDDVGIVRAVMFQHLDWNWREPAAKPLTKAAFRYTPDAEMALGNHDVFGVPGRDIYDVLGIREIQYRGVEHFIRKVRERCATIDPALPQTEGTHHRELNVLTDDELRGEWPNRIARATLHDPIPSRSSYRTTAPSS